MKGILNIVGAVEDPPADAKHHGAMPMEQRLERCLVPARGEALDELSVAQGAMFLWPNHSADLPQDALNLTGRHRRGPCLLVIFRYSTCQDADKSDFLEIAVADEMYLAVLTRTPTHEEREMVGQYLARKPERRPVRLGHLAWALLTSTEFCVNH